MSHLNIAFGGTLHCNALHFGNKRTVHYTVYNERFVYILIFEHRIVLLKETHHPLEHSSVKYKIAKIIY